MAIKSAYSASLSCSSFIPFENSKMGLMNSNCRPATNRREQGEATTIVSSLSQNKLPETHRSMPRSEEDRQAGKNPYIMFQVWLKPPFTSHHYWWAPTTMAEKSGSNYKMMLFLGFLKCPTGHYKATANRTRHQLLVKAVKKSEAHKYNIYTFHCHTITSFKSSSPLAFKESFNLMLQIHLKSVWAENT